MSAAAAPILAEEYDEEREHEALQGAAHDHAGEERRDELDPVQPRRS